MHLLLPLAGALRPMVPLDALAAVGQATQKPVSWRTPFKPWEGKRRELPTSPLGQIDDALLLQIKGSFPFRLVFMVVLKCSFCSYQRRLMR